jgi:hypothetical protein
MAAVGFWLVTQHPGQRLTPRLAPISWIGPDSQASITVTTRRHNSSFKNDTMTPLSIALLLGLAVSALAKIEPFPLHDVRLLNDSMPARYERINSKYLLDMLDADRLLWVFRTNAKLPAPGKPYIGSWEVSRISKSIGRHDGYRAPCAE